MEENKVEITVSEYHELLRTAERVAVFKRMLARDDYISNKDIKAIFDFEEVQSKGEKENA